MNEIELIDGPFDGANVCFFNLEGIVYIPSPNGQGITMVSEAIVQNLKFSKGCYIVITEKRYNQGYENDDYTFGQWTEANQIKANE